MANLIVDKAGEHSDGFLVEIRNAKVFREAYCVFRDLSLAISIGCHTVILGPNGSGKSTFLKLLSRDLYPVERPQTILRLMGEDTWNVWDLRAKLGILSAELQGEYPGHASGLEVVLSGFFASYDLYAHHHISVTQRAKSYDVMKMVGVEYLTERLFGEMSLGEQRRVLLGRALVHNPAALILDEPTTGLDIQGCFRYLASMRAYMQEGHTLVLVTHHLHEIPPEIDRVVLLKHGEVVGDGPKAEILTAERLSDLFETRVQLIEQNGWYQVLPQI
ncbi:MAG: ATP-binding cassette domain-containing protein [Nitrospirales bacterium]|nr:ATP-binding cassette domain-containing protein [Nitrospirales bacterium]